jgi:hypothetical protein
MVQNLRIWNRNNKKDCMTYSPFLCGTDRAFYADVQLWTFFCFYLRDFIFHSRSVRYFRLRPLPGRDPYHSIFRNLQEDSYTTEIWTNHALTRQAKKTFRESRIRDGIIPGSGINIPDPQKWRAVYLAEHDYEARLRLVHHPPELGASAPVGSATGYKVKIRPKWTDSKTPRLLNSKIPKFLVPHSLCTVRYR